MLSQLLIYQDRKLGLDLIISGIKSLVHTDKDAVVTVQFRTFKQVGNNKAPQEVIRLPYITIPMLNPFL